MNILDIRVEDLPEGITHYDLREYRNFTLDSCLQVDSEGKVRYSDGLKWIRFSDSLDQYIEGMHDPRVPPVTIQDILDAQQQADKDKIVIKESPEPYSLGNLPEIGKEAPEPYSLDNLPEIGKEWEFNSGSEQDQHWGLIEVVGFYKGDVLFRKGGSDVVFYNSSLKSFRPLDSRTDAEKLLEKVVDIIEGRNTKLFTFTASEKAVMIIELTKGETK